MIYWSTSYYVMIKLWCDSMRKRRKSNTNGLKGILMLIIGVLLIFFLISRGGAVDLQTFAKNYGWEIDEATKVHKKVTIPKEFTVSEDAFNCLQKDIGSDLKQYKGKAADMYIYKVTNRAVMVDKTKVPLYIALIVYNDAVIAGSIYSDELKSFELSLKGRSLEQIEGVGVEQWRNKVNIK